MKVADVTGVAWQQMCVSSWQDLAASPVSGGGWTCSGVPGICVSPSPPLPSRPVLSLFSPTPSDRQQMPSYTERIYL